MPRSVAGWLRKFAAALAKGDLDAAGRLFGEECYWRDLISFTWNIRTCEGRAEIHAMLAATLAQTQPRAFNVLSRANKNEAWFSFETAVGRGTGHLRLKGGKGWTLLTTLQ